MIKRIQHGKPNAVINLSRCNRKYTIVIGILTDTHKDRFV